MIEKLEKRLAYLKSICFQNAAFEVEQVAALVEYIKAAEAMMELLGNNDIDANLELWNRLMDARRALGL